MSLDPAVRTGFAIGNAGEMPTVGAVRLKRPSQHRDVAIANIGCFLRDRFVLDKPDLLCMLHWMQPSAQKHADAAIMSLMLAGAVQAIAGIYGVRVEQPYDATVRVHFCGKGHAGKRDETNRMVLRRAITLGYLPRECTDWDRANAAAAFDYASTHYARKSPRSLVLFGEQVSA